MLHSNLKISTARFTLKSISNFRILRRQCGGSLEHLGVQNLRVQARKRDYSGFSRCLAISSVNRSSFLGQQYFSRTDRIGRKEVLPKNICTRSSERHYSSTFKVSQDGINNDNMNRLSVAILGPPNAGKSTLFNRLICKESNRMYKLGSEKKSKKNHNINIKKSNRSRGRIGHSRHAGTGGGSGGAIVSTTPGTTRDRRECIGRIGDTYFTLMDTAGVDAERIDLLEGGKSKKDEMEVNMMKQTLEAARNADLIFLMFDARVGLTTDLAETTRWLRKVGASRMESMDNHDDNKSNGPDVLKISEKAEWKRRVVILANKLEGDHWSNYFDVDSPIMDHLLEVSRLGFGEAIPISAEHGEGLADIAGLINNLSEEKKTMFGVTDVDEEENDETIMISKGGTKIERKEKEKPLQLAILGRQNVGKSTLVNSLLKEERVIAGDKPGLTRDAIAIKWSWGGRPVQLVDTAGIRRMAKRDHSDNIEDLAVRDAMRAMKVADVAVLVLDAEARMLQRQELAIADSVVREGRSLVVAANKMDLLVDGEYSKEEYAQGVRHQIEMRFPMLRETPVVPMCSLSGEAVDDLMPVVFEARDRWAQTINTGLLNRWLIDVMEHQAPPFVHGRPAKIKYILQTKGRPPTFLLFCNVDALPTSYMRFLTRNFQETFSMYGMEVRLAVKKNANNPFHDKEKSTRVGMGVGGRDARKKRMVADLKLTGKPKRKGVRRRMQKRFK
jgi:GTP-binding protein